MTDTKYSQYQESIPLLNGWTESEVADFLKRGTMRQIERSTTIFDRGTRGNELYIVFSGVVDIFLGEIPLAQCNVGDTFGAISAIDHRVHTATAVAGTDVLLFMMTSEKIAEVLKQPYATRFLQSVVHILAGHIANANTHIAALESKLARIERVRTPAVHE